MDVSAMYLQHGAAPAAPPQPADGPAGAKLRGLIEQLVGTTLIQPLLNSVHDTALRGAYGHGGRGEDVFAQQLDVVLAERMASSSRLGLVDALYDRMSRRGRAADTRPLEQS